ncbi:MAG: hypothetical protein GY711_17925 [bacterium]|nr:hypothetical protein [bacterium]
MLQVLIALPLCSPRPIPVLAHAPCTETRLIGSRVQPGDQMGRTVAIEGDRMLVGSPNEAPGGAAYVFERQGADWVETARLQPAVIDPLARFGFAVHLRGDGAPNQTSSAGAVHIFEASDSGAWAEHPPITPSGGAPGDTFGHALDSSGRTTHRRGTSGPRD